MLGLRLDVVGLPKATRTDLEFSPTPNDLVKNPERAFLTTTTTKESYLKNSKFLKFHFHSRSYLHFLHNLHNYFHDLHELCLSLETGTEKR